jgi:RimJ/RimL family protein N-acetyltransferase
MIRHSFAPFGPREVALLTEALDIDYSRIDFASPRWLCVAGYEGDELLGLCCFEFVNRWDPSFTIVIRDRRCITRRVMQAMFTAVFSQAVRVSAEIEPANQHSITLAGRMGFTVEGYKPLAIEGRRDALLLGMTRDTCRFLRAPRAAAAPTEGKRHGRLSQGS